ncbi:hypothetical protein [Streptomyces sp. E-08]|uniref:hypothetical protein n=1 Tax=Streptomyces sp. E-08 TaxID=3404047 RepID=UPI003CECF747
MTGYLGLISFWTAWCLGPSGQGYWLKAARVTPIGSRSSHARPPTFLSDLGGPFLLHKAPDPADEDTETTSTEPS